MYYNDPCPPGSAGPDVVPEEASRTPPNDEGRATPASLSDELQSVGPVGSALQSGLPPAGPHS